MPDAADGGGATDKPEKKSKIKTIKVRNNTAQPLAVDGIILQPRVLTKDGKVAKEAPETEIPEKHLDRLGDWVTKVGCILFAALLLFTSSASAQQYSFRYASTSTTNVGSGLFTNPFVLNGIPTNALSVNGTNTTFNSLAAGGTNTYNLIFPITKYGDFSAFMSSAAISGSTSNSVWTWEMGPDATNWVPLATITLAQNGTTAVTYGTNWAETILGNFGYVRLKSLASSTAIVAQTNITVLIPTKPSRRGS